MTQSIQDPRVGTQRDRTLQDAPGQDGPERDRTQDVFVVERPWGRFQQFTTNEPLTVKTITIEPGCRLSLQTHGHRAEMWQVLDGAADVQVDDRAWTARPGDMVWVPPGAVHRLGNSTAQRTRILELAFGPFDEADIIRLQDDYARCVDDETAPGDR